MLRKYMYVCSWYIHTYNYIYIFVEILISLFYLSVDYNNSVEGIGKGEQGILRGLYKEKGR